MAGSRSSCPWGRLPVHNHNHDDAAALPAALVPFNHAPLACRPHRLQVDLYAATSAAKARSMQQIRGEKQARAEAYHNALAHRAQLPRFLRMLDLRLAGALAGMAAGSVADAAAALHAAAPGLLPGAAAGVGQGCGQDTSADGELADSPVPAEAAAGSGEGPATPAFLCSLVVEAGGGIGFSPSQAEWAAALEGEVLASSLRLAGGVLPLLRLPAFERYQVQQAAEGAAAGEPEQAEQQPAGAAELAERDGEFVGAAADLAAMVQHSFARAGQLARQYQQYLAIHQFGCNWDYEAWATQQRWAARRARLACPHQAGAPPPLPPPGAATRCVTSCPDSRLSPAPAGLAWTLRARRPPCASCRPGGSSWR